MVAQLLNFSQQKKSNHFKLYGQWICVNRTAMARPCIIKALNIFISTLVVFPSFLNTPFFSAAILVWVYHRSALQRFYVIYTAPLQWMELFTMEKFFKRFCYISWQTWSCWTCLTKPCPRLNDMDSILPIILWDIVPPCETSCLSWNSAFFLLWIVWLEACICFSVDAKRVKSVFISLRLTTIINW